ncbi:TonB-dependent receptor domain-containing protein [Indioceanicola profundi]|uniref:TonB-dependent receptor domain-containing protein n=1 Tax=Indioceanicola profundi TaxID=2220096 RepID=UPI000E6AD90C|nr:TonB-dependent receptor [Indioceanicola profundi]
MMLMVSSGRLRRAGLRAGFLAGCCGAAILAVPAVAQEAPADVPLEEIVVTGSRIARPELESPIPVVVLTAEQMALEGETNVSEALDTLPALSNSISSEQSVLDGAAVGVATLDLRGLGVDRTLVLVNGRRHVAGVPGSAAVDINSIPEALIERVDVLTGGASAIYGGDAVTGVVNFVLKRNFEGVEASAQITAPEEEGGIVHTFDLTMGRNFGPDDRANLTASFSHAYDEGVRAGERGFSRNRGRADDYPNPALFFQPGELTQEIIDAGFAIGDSILDAVDAGLTVPQSLIDRTEGAPSRVIRRRPTFSISSFDGRIGFGNADSFDYGDPAFDAFVDLDNDGNPDCAEPTVESNAGYGCLVFDPALNNVRPFQNGAAAGGFNQFDNPDGAGSQVDRESIIPRNERLIGNLMGSYEVSPAFRPFFEAKFASVTTHYYSSTGAFNDAVPIALDNPYLPTALLTEINEFLAANPDFDASTAKVTVSRDFPELSARPNRIERETIRLVGGFDGEFDNGWTYELAANWGQTKEDSYGNQRIEDRFYAAVDAVRDPATGNIVCRSSLTGSRELSVSPFPFYAGEISTFDPLDGTCQPLNIFGQGNASAEAIDFVAYQQHDESTIEQFVLSGFLSGDSAALFELPGGPLAFAIGGEYRDEQSEYIPDELADTGLLFDSDPAITEGGYDVWGVSLELSAPLLRDLPFVQFLAVDGAVRYDEYSTDVGGAWTYKVGGTYQPADFLSIRGGLNRTIRAPNIAELFSPLSSAFFRPVDPCDANEINQGPAPENRLANCRADGIPEGYTDPLSARFRGESGGNPDLTEETSDSWTVGAVFQPDFVPGLTVTVDYWDITIDDAIVAVSAQDIVDGCYDADSLENPFCDLIGRNRESGSPQFLGLNFLRQTQVNFASLEAAGVDWDVRYTFDLADIGINDDSSLTLGVRGTYMDKLVRYASVANPNAADDELGELERPQWAFNTNVQYRRDRLTLNWSTFWEESTYLRGVEADDFERFAPYETGNTWVHNLSAAFELTEQVRFIAGVNNLTDEKPFLTEFSIPVSARGRSYFLRATASF